MTSSAPAFPAGDGDLVVVPLARPPDSLDVTRLFGDGHDRALVHQGDERGARGAGEAQIASPRISYAPATHMPRTDPGRPRWSRSLHTDHTMDRSWSLDKTQPRGRAVVGECVARGLDPEP
jgi:hypothetical protein